MLNFNKTKIFLLIIVLFFGILQPVLAQVRDSDISISLSPETPGPLQDVSVSISSFSTDLDKAQISWTLNSKEALVGIGKKTFSFRTPNGGETSTVDVYINIAGAPSISKRIIIQPGEVNLLWEAVDSYVPPFYRGKALLSSEGEVKVVAIPNITTPSGVKMKNSDFSYNWKRNSDYDQSVSGYNKSSFTFQNSYLEDAENINVSISSVLGNYTATSDISITPSDPKILFYEQDPYSGINYNKNITDGFSILNNKLQIIAAPYFFSAQTDPSQLKYEWSINNSSIATPNIPNILAVQVGNKTSNQAKIDLKIENESKLFQTANISALLNILK